MKIFLSHSKDFDYKNQLYLPIKNHYKKDLFFLPEEHKINTKKIISECDVVFVEISNKGSFGSGIEVGWADSFNKPIYCFYKNGTQISNSIKYLTDNIFAYDSIDELLKIMDKIIEKL